MVCVFVTSLTIHLYIHQKLYEMRCGMPIGGVVARAEFGAPGCGCSPATTAILFYLQARATQHATSRHPDRSPDRQLDKGSRPPLLPHVSVLFTSIPFKYSLSMTRILNQRT